MKKTIRTVLAAALVLAMAFSLCACGDQPLAEDAVRDFCDAMQTMDLKTMDGFLIQSTREDRKGLGDLLEGENAEDYSFLVDYLRESAGEMKYQIVKASQDGDKGTVRVRFEYTDASDVVRRALQDYKDQMLSLAMSGAGKDAMRQAMEDCFAEAVKTTQTGRSAVTVDFPCTKKNGQWLIDKMPEELRSVLMANTDKALDSFSLLPG